MSQENNFVPEQETYKPLSPFKLFVKSNFPFIEATFEALDNYGLYCKIVEYLNDVIANENLVEDNVTSLYNAFVSLNTYVSDYFDNLDVQQEINDKLDSMALSGELTHLLKPYFDSLQNEVDVLSARVDEITSLPEGSTSGDAELADIRIGYNGTTYNTAGNAVRGQIQDLYNYINNTELLAKLNISKAVLYDNLGKAISSTTGNLTNYETSETSDLYNCKAGDKLFFRIYTNSANRNIIATYNSSNEVERIIKASDYGLTAAGLLRGTFEFLEGETSFRISHSSSENKYEFVTYQTNDKINDQNIITPEMFNATNDISIDNTQYFQKMLDCAYFNNFTVFLPNGRKYLISNPLILHSYNDTYINESAEEVATIKNYSIFSNNYSSNENIYTESDINLFVGENYVLNNTSTYVNINMSNVSFRAKKENSPVLFNRLTFINESVIEKIKVIHFETIFEAGTVRTGSEIRLSTFFGIKSAFMTNKNKDLNGEYTVGSDVGFLADSRICNCYISGSIDYFPSCFIGTHGDTDTIIDDCFFEFFRYIFDGGYSQGFNGIIFSNCDIQYGFRFCNRGANYTKFTNCYITGYSANGLLSKIDWEGLSDLIENPVGFICSNLSSGLNTENLYFKINFDGCLVNNCDNFITLLGDSNGYNFDNSLIKEKNTVYVNDSPDMTSHVNVIANYDINSYFESIDNLFLEDTPAAYSDGKNNNSFVGQHIMYNNDVYYCMIKNGSLEYHKL